MELSARRPSNQGKGEAQVRNPVNAKNSEVNIDNKNETRWVKNKLPLQE